jgi:3-oxoadipate CoA-transferase, beta subunit
VNRVYTDHGMFDVTPNGFVVREIIEGLSFDELQKLAQVPLTFEPLEAANTLDA